MSMLLPVLLLAILLATMALTWAEGMWSNALRLINAVTAGLLAMNYFEPVADWLTGQNPRATYLWDFVALWGLFVVFTVVLRELTDRASRVKVRFLKLADQIGSWAFAFLTGWVMVCFTLTSLHTAPLAKNFLFGGFNYQNRMFFGMFAPDWQWLSLVKSTSTGVYCCSPVAEFSPGNTFGANYEARRAALEEQIAKTDTVLAQ